MVTTARSATIIRGSSVEDNSRTATVIALAPTTLASIHRMPRRLSDRDG